MSTRIQLRRGTAAQWQQTNPVLAVGEAGYETDTGILRIGDNETPYTSLRPVYANGKTDSFMLEHDGWSLSEIEDEETGEITTGLPYYQTIPVDLMFEDFNPHVSLIISSDDYETVKTALKEYSKIFKGESGNGFITFYALTPPKIDLEIKVKRL